MQFQILTKHESKENEGRSVNNDCHFFLSKLVKNEARNSDKSSSLSPLNSLILSFISALNEDEILDDQRVLGYDPLSKIGI